MRFIASLLVALFFSSAAYASQNATALPLTGTYSGLTAAGYINNANDTMVSHFSGTAAPSVPTSYQFWADTTNNIFNLYGGSSWLPVGKFSGSLWVPFSNGVLTGGAPTSTGSSNAYVVAQTPVISAYVIGQIYNFTSSFANTSAATVNFGPGAKTIKKNSNVDLAVNDIKSGQGVSVFWDGTNFQMMSQIGTPSAGGTLTSLTCGTGLTCTSVNPIVASGTVALSSISNNTVLGNVSGGSAAPSAITPSQILSGICTTQGNILYYNGSNWVCLAVGSSGQLLITNGSSANPSWTTYTGSSSITTLGTVTSGTLNTGNVRNSMFNTNLEPLTLDRNGTTGNIIAFNYGNGLKGTIAVDSGGTTYNTTSDGRLKDQIRDLDYPNNFFDTLRAVKFRWRENHSEGIGFIAQEVKKLAPQAVTDGHGEYGDKDFRPMVMDQSKLIPYMAAELKSLRRRIKRLEHSCVGRKQ